MVNPTPIRTGDKVALRLNPTGPQWRVEDVKKGQLLLRLCGFHFEGALEYGWSDAGHYVRR